MWLSEQSVTATVDNLLDWTRLWVKYIARLEGYQSTVTVLVNIKILKSNIAGLKYSLVAWESVSIAMIGEVLWNYGFYSGQRQETCRLPGLAKVLIEYFAFLRFD